MHISISLVITFFLIGIFSFLTLQLAKRKNQKLIKYTPAIASAFGLFLFSLKMLFITKGYNVIYDVLIIISLSFTFGLSILIALIIEVLNIKRSSLQN